MQGGFVQRQTTDRSPEVQDVPFNPTIRVEALKGVLAQVDGERALRGSGVAMHGTGTSALRTTATQVGQQSQMVKHLFHSHLLAQVLEIYPGSWRRDGLRRCLDERGVGPYGGDGRDDHFLRGLVPFVAHGLVVGRWCCLGPGSLGMPVDDSVSPVPSQGKCFGSKGRSVFQTAKTSCSSLRMRWPMTTSPHFPWP